MVRNTGIWQHLTWSILIWRTEENPGSKMVDLCFQVTYSLRTSLKPRKSMAWFPFFIQNPFSPGTAPVPLTTGGVAVAFVPQPRSKTRFRQRYKTLSGHVTFLFG